MVDALTRKWWVLLVRGLFGLLVGALAFAVPGLALLSVVMVWAVFAEIDGIGALMLAASGRHSERSRWSLLVVGVLGVLAGLLTWLWPSLTLVALLWIVAAWAIGRGLFLIIAALELRREIDGEWLLILSGALSLVFGVVMIAQPVTGLVAIAYLIGLYASAVGLLEIALAFRVRQFRRSLAL